MDLANYKNTAKTNISFDVNSVKDEFSLGNKNLAINMIKDAITFNNITSEQKKQLENIYQLPNKSVVDVYFVEDDLVVEERTEKEQQYYNHQINRVKEYIKQGKSNFDILHYYVPAVKRFLIKNDIEIIEEQYKNAYLNLRVYDPANKRSRNEYKNYLESFLIKENIKDENKDSSDKSGNKDIDNKNIDHLNTEKSTDLQSDKIKEELSNIEPNEVKDVSRVEDEKYDSVVELDKVNSEINLNNNNTQSVINTDKKEEPLYVKSNLSENLDIDADTYFGKTQDEYVMNDAEQNYTVKSHVGEINYNVNTDNFNINVEKSTPSILDSVEDSILYSDVDNYDNTQNNVEVSDDNTQSKVEVSDKILANESSETSHHIQSVSVEKVLESGNETPNLINTNYSDISTEQKTINNIYNQFAFIDTLPKNFYNSIDLKIKKNFVEVKSNVFWILQNLCVSKNLDVYKFLNEPKTTNFFEMAGVSKLFEIAANENTKLSDISPHKQKQLTFAQLARYILITKAINEKYDNTTNLIIGELLENNIDFSKSHEYNDVVDELLNNESVVEGFVEGKCNTQVLISNLIENKYNKIMSLYNTFNKNTYVDAYNILRDK